MPLGTTNAGTNSVGFVVSICAAKNAIIKINTKNAIISIKALSIALFNVRLLRFFLSGDLLQRKVHTTGKTIPPIAKPNIYVH